jgi:hypothetical protein
MRARSAATLVEVLVAIFVMGIGLLAILALFPIGAYRMAQAIQDDRMANIGLTSDAVATMWWPTTNQDVRHDSTVQAALATTNPGGPSWPVLVDPIGWRSFGGAASSPLASTSVVRCSVSFISSAPASNQDALCLRWFSILDDINFSNLGSAINNGLIERDIRYSWAYLCQAPNSSDLSVVNLTTIAFNRRPLSLSNATLSPPETSYSATFDMTRNVVTVNYGASGTLPNLRVGEWIMDATQAGNSAHAYFYRVVSIDDQGSSLGVEYEVQQPLRMFPGGGEAVAWTSTNTSNAGTVIVLEGVAEVFERGTGRLP